MTIRASIYGSAANAETLSLDLAPGFAAVVVKACHSREADRLGWRRDGP